MNRRNFLKGGAAVAVIPVIGLPVAGLDPAKIEIAAARVSEILAPAPSASYRRWTPYAEAEASGLKMNDYGLMKEFTYLTPATQIRGLQQ